MSPNQISFQNCWFLLLFFPNPVMPRKSKDPGNRPSLESLPENVLSQITECVASRSAKEFGKLQRVSRTFRGLCKDGNALKVVSFDEFTILPLLIYREEYEEFLERCVQSGNPDAKYRKGLLLYFHPDSDELTQEEALELIKCGADNGVLYAKYWYGLILICLGGEDKRKGYEILAPLYKAIEEGNIMPADPNHQRNLICLRNLQCHAKVQILKSRYVRDVCKCNGIKDDRLDDTNELSELFISVIMQQLYYFSPSLVCEICLWHDVLQITFDAMEM